MSTATEGSPWATKAEASAHQVRRFSQLRETTLEELPPLPPLVRPYYRESTPPPFDETPHNAATTDGPRSTPLQRPRASTAEAERQGDAVPSVATLSRELDRLSLAYAGTRMDAAAGAAPPTAATHHAGRFARRTSAPTAARPSLPSRSRPESGGATTTATATITTAATTAAERKDAPMPAPPLPHLSTPFHRRNSSEAVAGTVERPSQSSSLPSLVPPEPPTSVTADEPLSVGPSELSEATSPAPGAAPPPTTPVAEGEEPTDTTAEVTAVDGAEEADDAEDRNNASPQPRHSKRQKSTTAATSKATSPTPNSRGNGRDGRITVVVRKRPLAADEAGPDCVEVHGPHVRITVTKQRVDLSSYTENSDYTFDHAYDTTASNNDVYATSVKELLTVSLAGGSASCFAYGQTGSGKTYTMMGTDGESGLYLLAAADLFDRLGPGQQLCVCFYEIYCNSLFDLLNRRHPIVLREDANRRVNICGVVWRTVTTVAELWQLVRAGMEQRRTGSTSANEHSSRSHAVLSIRVKDAAHLDFAGNVNFVDLAGSERAADTAANDRLTRLEGAEINKSLLALKECIRALDEKKKHVPFRGSRLTEVLRDSFTGNSKTVMIATVSPASHNHEHSNNTLRYAFRVKGLSIATVEPSKARNAPRPYIPVARSRSNVGLEDKLNASPAPSRDVRRKVSAGVVDSTNAASPSRQQQARRRRHSHRKSRVDNNGGGSTGEDDAATTPPPSTTSAMSEQTEAMERNSMAELRARRAAQERHNSIAKRRHPSSRHDIASLLPTRQRNDSAASLHRGQRPVYKPPPSNPVLLLSCSSTGSTASSNLNASLRRNAPPLPPLVTAGSPRKAVDIAALERRLTHQIMAQLRQDLGRQLEEVLSEKDATITALRRENETLRKALDRAQHEAGHSDNSPSPQETEGRRMGETVPLGFYPPSPSILQEETSSGASLSSASDDGGYHVI